MPDGQKEVGIERLHLEQDAGKSIHDLDPKNTFVDLNRSGVALMEIVSKPDLRSPDEVNAYIKKLRSIMRYLGTCDGNMQEGSLRADVNVSVRKKGSKEFGTRCEIKNVNSIKFMQMAIEYEANRQVDLIEDGQTIDQETRLFDTKKNETRSMRSKEDAHDYRYFPDPDLLPLEVSDEFINELKNNIPELPDDKKKRFIDEFKLSPYEATILVSDIDTANYFEEVVTKMGKNKDMKLAVNWITGEEISYLPIGGTAIGTGINAPKMFGKNVCNELNKIYSEAKIRFKPLSIKGEMMSSQNHIFSLSSALTRYASTLSKIANDLRWMNILDQRRKLLITHVVLAKWVLMIWQ